MYVILKGERALTESSLIEELIEFTPELSPELLSRGYRMIVR